MRLSPIFSRFENLTFIPWPKRYLLEEYLVLRYVTAIGKVQVDGAWEFRVDLGKGGLQLRRKLGSRVKENFNVLGGKEIHHQCLLVLLDELEGRSISIEFDHACRFLLLLETKTGLRKKLQKK